MAATASSLSNPLIGRTYERQSITQAFNNDQLNSIKSFLSSNTSSLSALSTTNTTPKKKTSDRLRPHTRACLVWKKNERNLHLIINLHF